PDDDEQGAGDGDEGLELAAALDQAAVAFAEEGAGLAGGGRGVAEDAFEVGVAFGDPAGLGAVAGLDGARAEPGPGDQVGGGGEAGHVEADLGDDDVGGVPGDAGDLGEPVDGGQGRGVRAAAGLRAGGAVGVDALSGGDRADQLIEAGGELVDLAAEAVDLGEQDRGELAVVVIEPAGQSLDQGGAF